METIGQLPAFLQYGAFGLLTLILVGVFVFVRSSLNRSQAFIEKVADSSIAAKDEHIKAFQALAERSIVAQEKLTICMQQMTVNSEREFGERRREHSEIDEKLEKVLNNRLKQVEAEVASLKTK